MTNTAKQLSDCHEVSAKVAQLLQTRTRLAFERYSGRAKESFESASGAAKANPMLPWQISAEAAGAVDADGSWGFHAAYVNARRRPSCELNVGVPWGFDGDSPQRYLVAPNDCERRRHYGSAGVSNGLRHPLFGHKILRPAAADSGTRLGFVWVRMGCLGGFEVPGLAGLFVGLAALDLSKELWERRVRDVAASDRAEGASSNPDTSQTIV